MNKGNRDVDTANGLTYADAGVDIDKGNALVRMIAPLIRTTARPGADAAIGGFGGVFDLKALGYRDPLLVAANDGVGTKLKLAIDTGKHDTVGIDLVAMCVNDLIVQGAEPIFFLDYFSTGALDLDDAGAVVSGIVEGCRQAGAALIGGETAEMPGLYAEGDYDLAGFAVGIVERDNLLPANGAIRSGDRILGLASSGPHSNGYSLIRKVVSLAGADLQGPAPFDSAQRLGDALLTPTRIYVRSILRALNEGSGIKALAHITGGGFTENIPRVLPDGFAASIDLSSFRMPPVFDWLARQGGIAESEMLRTFNCGIGMIVIVPADEAASTAALLGDAGETVVNLGEIVPENDERVVFRGRLKPAEKSPS